MTSGGGRFVPGPLRPIARRVARALRDRGILGGARPAPAVPASRPATADEPIPEKTAAELRDYWRDPPDGNVPASYRDRPERSAYLVELVRRHVAPGSRILEIGCNVGRNLHYLYEAGYTELSGIEISAAAVDALRASYPDTAARAAVQVAAAEEALPGFADGAFDLVFTMAVLEHIHPESEWLFDEIRRIDARHLITIEDERSKSWRHYPRDYGAIFGGRGFEELWTEPVPAETGLPSGFRARLFQIVPVAVATPTTAGEG
ncbi:MAG TPA: class I SAM-dependent methyltransferase [Candidatus Limnocylindrales bacterium]|jgi:SAM-dependent methyltransferase